MGRKCSISGKRAQRGSKVSHSNNKSLKKWEVNLQNKRLFDSETGRWIRLRVSTRMLRTIDRKGLSAALRDAGMDINKL